MFRLPQPLTSELQQPGGLIASTITRIYRDDGTQWQSPRSACGQPSAVMQQP
jgi:hypothetical protein